jgi:predicted MPP superfamily phosphohydrolase
MFFEKSEVIKEVMNYDYYNRETIAKRFNPIEEILKDIKDNEKEQFKNNCSRWGCFEDDENKSVDIIKYSLKFTLKKNFKFKFISLIGLFLSILIGIGILYAMLIGKNDFTVRNTEIVSNKLPKSFEGLKIVQLSDIHIGSFYYNTKALTEVVNKINDLNPDIVILTGDLVNNFTEEADGLDSIFNRINAPLGKLAVLGNHDFGDYTIWRTPETKSTNLDKIILHYKAMGFNLLRNESTYISNGKDSIIIAGVDNWGLPPFKQYGDFKKAIKNIKSGYYTIMLSHDPTHWNEEIKFSKKVDLTFSGHTHGMQIGIEKFGYRWSPVKYKYEQWAGLYQNKNSNLYVNRGLGCIGFLGRIGMPPEITVMVIKTK